jgi:serine/threonine-protein kinase RsbW
MSVLARPPFIQDQEGFSLEIPCDPGYLTTARLFAAVACRELGIDEETTEDVKLTVSEVCTGAIRGHADGTAAAVRIDIRREDTRLVFELGSQSPIVLGPDGSDFQALIGSDPDQPAEEIGLALIQGLFDNARIEVTRSGGTVLTFSIPAPANLG